MDRITVNKLDLLDKLRENREHHIQVFHEAIEGYREKARVVLEASLDELDTEPIPPKIEMKLPYPEEHTSDYDRAIQMLEMHTGNTIEVSDHEFRQYVQDEWDWHRSFAANTVSYTGKTW